MTTHQLARLLLEMEDLPAISLDDSGNYVNIRSVFESEVSKNRAGYVLPAGFKDKVQAIPVVIIT